MNYRIAISVVLCTLGLPCCGQKPESSSTAPVDFLRYINEENVGLSYVKTGVGSDEELTVPYYDLFASELEVGYASLFAVSKKLSEEWVIESIKTPKGKCRKEGDYYSSFYVKCEATRLLTEDISSALHKFNLYTFFIPKSDLEEPFVEQAEGGEVYNYFPKKESTFIIYKYEKTQWNEIGRVTQEGDEIPRFFGRQHIEQKLLH